MRKDFVLFIRAKLFYKLQVFQKRFQVQVLKVQFTPTSRWSQFYQAQITLDETLSSSSCFQPSDSISRPGGASC